MVKRPAKRQPPWAQETALHGPPRDVSDLQSVRASPRDLRQRARDFGTSAWDAQWIFMALG